MMLAVTRSVENISVPDDDFESGRAAETDDRPKCDFATSIAGSEISIGEKHPMYTSRAIQMKTNRRNPRKM